MDQDSATAKPVAPTAPTSDETTAAPAAAENKPVTTEATTSDDQLKTTQVMIDVAEKIAGAQNVLVALSSDPSVDELSAAIGLSIFLDRLGKRATAIYSGTTPNVLEFLKPSEIFETSADTLQDFVIALNKDKADHLRYKLDGDFVKIFITPYKTKISQEDLAFSYGDYNVDLVLALDVANGTDLDSALREHGRIMHDAVIIDITTGNPGKLGEIEWSEKDASSVSEMIARLLYTVTKETIEQDEATAFLTGIVAATNRFSNARTTPETMEIASRLMRSGANQQLVSKNITPEIDNELLRSLRENENTAEKKEIVEETTKEVAEETKEEAVAETAEEPASQSAEETEDVSTATEEETTAVSAESTEEPAEKTTAVDTESAKAEAETKSDDESAETTAEEAKKAALAEAEAVAETASEAEAASEPTNLHIAHLGGIKLSKDGDTSEEGTAEASADDAESTKEAETKSEDESAETATVSETKAEPEPETTKEVAEESETKPAEEAPEPEAKEATEPEPAPIAKVSLTPEQPVVEAEPEKPTESEPATSEKPEETAEEAVETKTEEVTKSEVEEPAPEPEATQEPATESEPAEPESTIKIELTPTIAPEPASDSSADAAPEPADTSLLDDLKAAEESLAQIGAEAAPSESDTGSSSTAAVSITTEEAKPEDDSGYVGESPVAKPEDDASEETVTNPGEEGFIKSGPEKVLQPTGDINTTPTPDEQFGKMLENALDAAGASPAAPQVIVSPPENPAEAAAPAVPSNPEINGVPEINYAPTSTSEILPPPPTPPIDMTTSPMTMPPADAAVPAPTVQIPATPEPAPTAPQPADPNAFKIPGM